MPHSNIQIVWFRRDLRLTDHAALYEAAKAGPVLPVFIGDDTTLPPGAAARWRLGESIAALKTQLHDLGLPLILRKGPAREVLPALVSEVKADAVHWIRAYDPASIARDRALKSALGDMGIKARSYSGFTLREPWEVETKSGTPFKVFSPFWKALSAQDVPHPLPKPEHLTAPSVLPAPDALEGWALGAGMHRGAEVLERYAQVGEATAWARLEHFLNKAVTDYADDRNRMDLPGTSGLSENLTYGEISPRQIWHSCQSEDQSKGVASFLRELGWRDFAWHLTYHEPHLLQENWRAGWEVFPWNAASDISDRWCRAKTGVPVIDAAMRQLYATGTMHNRARMLVASYLCKHLMTDWRVGRDWFEDTLIDWDPAVNAVSWQWVAGCGPDAAPYFRIFNPETQAEKFDPNGDYRAEYLNARSSGTKAYFSAIPRSWGQAPNDPRPEPMVTLADGRARALAAFESIK